MDKNKYIDLVEEAYVLNANNTYNLISRDEYNNFSDFAINDTGFKILNYVDGQTCIQKIVDGFIQDNSLTKCDEQWIIDFIEELIKKNFLVIREIPADKKRSLRILGKESYINPLQVTIEVTDKCNLRCKHCYLEASCNNKDYLSWNQINHLMDSLRENHVLSIELTGGELFIHPNAFEIIDKACKNFAQVAILTNGTILPENILNLLINNKDKIVISVSIDSTHPDIHDKFRGVKGSFEKTCHNVKLMTSNGLKVRISSSIFDENMWEIDKLANLSKELGAVAFVYNFVEDFGRGKDFNVEHGNVGANNQDYKDYLNKIVLDYSDIIPIIPSENFLKVSSNCGALSNSILIGSNGQIRPCAMFPKSSIFGNILEENIKEVVNKDIYKQILNLNPPHVEHGCDIECPNYMHCLGCYMKGITKNLFQKNYCSWVHENHIENILQLLEEDMDE